MDKMDKEIKRVCGDRVLVRRADVEEARISGLIVPEKWRAKPTRGKVLAVGSDVSGIVAGDDIIFTKHSGIVVDDYIILSKQDVIARVDKGNVEVLRNRYLVKLDEADEEIAIGSARIYVPQEAQYHRQAGVWGRILQVSAEIVDSLEVGTRVIVALYIGAQIMIDEVEYRLIKDMDILGYGDILINHSDTSRIMRCAGKWDGVYTDEAGISKWGARGYSEAYGNSGGSRYYIVDGVGEKLYLMLKE